MILQKLSTQKLVFKTRHLFVVWSIGWLRNKTVLYKKFDPLWLIESTPVAVCTFISLRKMVNQFENVALLSYAEEARLFYEILQEPLCRYCLTSAGFCSLKVQKKKNILSTFSLKGQTTAFCGAHVLLLIWKPVFYMWHNHKKFSSKFAEIILILGLNFPNSERVKKNFI